MRDQAAYNFCTHILTMTSNDQLSYFRTGHTATPLHTNTKARSGGDPGVMEISMETTSYIEPFPHSESSCISHQA